MGGGEGGEGEGGSLPAHTRHTAICSSSSPPGADQLKAAAAPASVLSGSGDRDWNISGPQSVSQAASASLPLLGILAETLNCEGVCVCWVCVCVVVAAGSSHM